MKRFLVALYLIPASFLLSLLAGWFMAWLPAVILWDRVDLLGKIVFITVPVIGHIVLTGVILYMFFRYGLYGVEGWEHR